MCFNHTHSTQGSPPELRLFLNDRKIGDGAESLNLSHRSELLWIFSEIGLWSLAHL